MAVYAQLADGRILEFPDGTDPAVVQATVKKVIASSAKPAEPETTVGGQAKEFFKGIPAGAVSMLKQAGVGLSSALPLPARVPTREAVQETAAPAEEYFKAAPGYEEAVLRKLGEGVGSTIPFFAAPFFGPASTAAGLGLAGLSGRGEARTRAEQAGATPEEIRKAESVGTAIGLSEMLAPGVGGQIKKLITRAFVRGGVEGAQESAAQIAQNLTAKGIYKPDQPIVEGAGEAGAYGFGVGALSSALIDMALGRRAARPAPKPTEGEKLNKEGEKVAEEILDTNTAAKPVEQIADETKVQQTAAVVQGAQQAEVNTQVAQQAAAINQEAQKIIESPAPITQEVQSEPLPATTEIVGEGTGTGDGVSGRPGTDVSTGESTAPELTGVVPSEQPVKQPDEGEAVQSRPVEVDPLFDQAKDLVIETQRASPSLVQRSLRIGYNRAQRILEQLEAEGVVSSRGTDDVRSVLTQKPLALENAPTEAAPFITAQEKRKQEQDARREAKKKEKESQQLQQAVQASQQILPTSTGVAKPIEVEPKEEKEESVSSPLEVFPAPNENWLKEKVEYVREQGRDKYGVPKLGSMTAKFREPVLLPVSVLKKLPGMMREQENVSQEKLDSLMKVMGETGKLPLSKDGKEHLPFIQVTYNGEAWVNEGNHRIMAADKLGFDKLPVIIEYYTGGERVKSGPLYPEKIGVGKPTHTTVVESVEEPKGSKSKVTSEQQEQADAIRKYFQRKLADREATSEDMIEEAIKKETGLNELLNNPTEENIEKAKELVRSIFRPVKQTAQSRSRDNFDPKEAEFVQKNLEGKTLIEVADWLAKNSPSKDYQLIAKLSAQKLRELEKAGVKFNFTIAHIGDMVPPSLLSARGIAESIYKGEKGYTTSVYLNGADVKGKVGTTYRTALHEIIHAATMSAIRLGNYKLAGNAQLAKVSEDLFAVKNYVVRHINERHRTLPFDKLTKFEQDILNREINALSSTDELVAWALTDSDMQAYLESIPYKNQKRSVWDVFVDSIRKFLRLPPSSDTALSEVLQVSSDLFKADISEMQKISGLTGTTLMPAGKPAQTTKTAKTTKTAVPRQDRTMDELRADAGLKLQPKTSIWKRLMSKAGREDIVRKLQNDRIYAKKIQDEMDLFGKTLYVDDEKSGKGKNAFYTFIIRSSSLAQTLANEHLKPIEYKVQDLLDKYVNESGKPLPDAMKDLDLYAQAEHDFERRVVKYILKSERNLREEYDPNLDKNKMSPADEYKDIMGRLPNVKTTKEARELRARMDELLFDKVDTSKDIAVPKRANYKEEVMKVRPDVLDITSNLYEVSGKTVKEIQEIKAAMAKDPNLATYKELMKVIREELQPATKDLNRMANHWTRPVDNTAEFYGYKNYVPLKGRPQVQKDDDNLELTGRKLGGEGQDIDIGFEGRLTDPQNSILQSMADAYKGALRAGRKDFFDALANAGEKGKLNPKGQDILKGVTIDKNVKFQDRKTLEEVKNIKGQANVFRYNEDGSIDVIKIRDEKLAEAIRRSYRTSNPFWDKLNQATSLIAQGHTRYNPSFAPVNFVADVFTNAYTMGAEFGPKKSLDMLWAVATDMGSNGLVFKAGKFAKLYNSGNFSEIRALAAKDPYYGELLEYVKEGKVSYLQGLATKGQFEELMKSVGPSRILRTKGQIDKVFDVYTDAFELASRVAAYRTAKTQFMAEGLDEASARIKAGVYAKELANFETIGQWGKELGGLFMFGRQAMTGAVRAVDALSNAASFDEAAFRAESATKGYSEAEINKAVKTRLEKQKSARLTSLALLGAGAAAYMLAYLGSDDDEQGRNRVATDDMSRWVRNLRIPIPGTDQFFQLRWGFGLGSFASAGAQIAGAFTSNTPLEDTLFNILSAGFESFAGLPVSKINMFENFPAFIVDSITPSIARPLFEFAMNTDSLGREIYNNRNSRYGDAYTGGDNIPEMFKAASRFLVDITNGGIDWSPNTMYFFANNYVDAISRYINYASGLTMVAAGSKDLTPKDLPIAESFLGGKSNVDAREFAKVTKKIEDMERKLKMFEANPAQYARYVEANPMHPAIVKIYNEQINSSLRDMRQMGNAVRRMSDLTPKERNEILDSLKLSQDLTKRYMLDMFKELNVEPGFFRGSGG